MKSLIPRKKALARVLELLDRHPVVALLGARQVGKTTLAREVMASRKPGVSYFDLEDPADLARLQDPMLALRNLEGLVILDEIQRKPDLFPVLRVLADQPGVDRRFLILGSVSPGLLRRSSESLAGRVYFFHLSGFGPEEVGVEEVERLWLRGGFPRSFLAASDRESREWRIQFTRTFLERDIPDLGIRIPPETLRRFWAMAAHYHGQVWNSSEFARSFGVSDATVRRYLDLLTSTFVLRLLPPWRENLKKRQVKAPKLYYTDTGLLHTQLRIETREDLLAHPKVGASWEGFALDTVIRFLDAEPGDYYFWATQGGSELDLLVFRGGKRLGFEFKFTEAPRVTRSMRIALEDLGLDRLVVVHAGEKSFPMGEKIHAVPWKELPSEIGKGTENPGR